MSIVRTILSLACLLGGGAACAAEIDDCRQLLLKGDYQQCEALTNAAIERGVYGESWHQILAAAQIAQGNYDGATTTLTSAMEKYSWSVRLRWQLMQE